jgi:hypothetical protein
MKYSLGGLPQGAEYCRVRREIAQTSENRLQQFYPSKNMPEKGEFTGMGAVA